MNGLFLGAARHRRVRSRACLTALRLSAGMLRASVRILVVALASAGLPSVAGLGWAQVETPGLAPAPQVTAPAAHGPTATELEEFFARELPPLMEEHRVPGVVVSVVVGG